MILSFKPEFKDKILEGEKIHTIRPFSKREITGSHQLHLATGVRTKHYNCFAEAWVEHVEVIEINLIDHQISTYSGAPDNFEELYWHPDFHRLKMLKPVHDIEALARADGFANVDKMFSWFRAMYKAPVFAGVLIHWTENNYHCEIFDRNTRLMINHLGAQSRATFLSPFIDGDDLPF